MMNTFFRFTLFLLALAFIGFVGCKDSGHSLGDSRDHDAGLGDTPVSGGGSTWSYGVSSSTASGGSAGSGSFLDAAGGGGSGAGGSLGSGAVGDAGSSSSISGGGTAGRGGSSAANDAGANDAGANDAATGTCGYRNDSCASRPCCAPLVCVTHTGTPTCYESSPPPLDAGSDTRVAADSDPRCPAGGCLDAGLSTTCPSSPPTDGSPCVGQDICNYEDCPGTGHTQAACLSGKWKVENGACGTVTCLGAGISGHTCPTNKVCLMHIGGALLVDCIDNPCGSGLVSADCSTVTTGCTPIFSTNAGLTFQCNTCPSGTCA